jgi:hypothetical protein
MVDPVSPAAATQTQALSVPVRCVPAQATPYSSNPLLVYRATLPRDL